jgi:hypothetical protein
MGICLDTGEFALDAPDFPFAAPSPRSFACLGHSAIDIIETVKAAWEKPFFHGRINARRCSVRSRLFFILLLTFFCFLLLCFVFFLRGGQDLATAALYRFTDLPIYKLAINDLRHPSRVSFLSKSKSMNNGQVAFIFDGIFSFFRAYNRQKRPDTLVKDSGKISYRLNNGTFCIIKNLRSRTFLYLRTPCRRKVRPNSCNECSNLLIPSVSCIIQLLNDFSYLH